MSGPTLKDVSAAIAAPQEQLRVCRELAGTHGTKLLGGIGEAARLELAIARADAAADACGRLASMLQERRMVLLARQAGRSGA